MIIYQIRTILIDQCSASCGGGFRRKTRECVNNEISRLGRQLVFDNPCKQALDVVQECNKQLCPEWTEWGEWTTCSKSCSGGRRRKFRQCVDRVSGGHRSVYSLPNMKSSTVILSPFQVAPLMSLLARETMKARRIVTLKPVLTGRLGQTGLNAQSLVAAGRGLRYKDFTM